MSRKKNQKQPPVYCPYCHGRAVLRPASYVYGDRAKDDETLCVCKNYPECDSYVRVHAGTNKPMGTLANRELRNARHRAHQLFDQIWKTGIMSRSQAYQWMRYKFGLSAAQGHIAKFSDYYCEQLIQMCEEMLLNNNRPIAS